MQHFDLTKLKLAVAALVIGTSGWVAMPAYAEDATVTDAVQALTDAVTQTGTDDATATAAEDAASDAASGLPKFNSREERRAYLKDLRQNDPDKFKDVMKKRQAHWAEKHPNAAERMHKGGRPYGRPEGAPDRDFRENRSDRREDIRDRREDRWDAKHDGGKWDRMEDRRDRAEDRMDRREDRWDAKHGPDRGRPGRGYGRPPRRPAPATATE